jgi:hypothetical protein
MEVPPPADIDLHRLPALAFGRFAIAYGLSIPFGEGPEIGLPRQFKKMGPPPVRPPTAVEYGDSKDVYD